MGECEGRKERKREERSREEDSERKQKKEKRRRAKLERKGGGKTGVEEGEICHSASV